MKYVWASWGNKVKGRLPATENTDGARTGHIRGYGCAVTFSTTRLQWSPAAMTYSLESKSFQASVCRN